MSNIGNSSSNQVMELPLAAEPRMSWTNRPQGGSGKETKFIATQHHRCVLHGLEMATRNPGSTRQLREREFIPIIYRGFILGGAGFLPWILQRHGHPPRILLRWHPLGKMKTCMLSNHFLRKKTQIDLPCPRKTWSLRRYQHWTFQSERCLDFTSAHETWPACTGDVQGMLA